MAANAPASAQGIPAACKGTEADAPSTASIVQPTGESLQRKRWQPQGGVIQFTIRTPALTDKASFYVCFRFKTKPVESTAATEGTPNGQGTATAGEDKDPYVQVRPDRLERNNDGTTWTVTTTVPIGLPDPPAGKTVDKALPLVPLADVRILAFAEDKKLAVNVATTIGISYRWAAILIALGTIALALAVLWIFAEQRLKHSGINQASWPLRIISTPSGYASLSQLQIVLWTLVVAGSAVYVMSLSGDLIQITEGTLVLLGIAGAAGVAAKVHTESQNSKAQSDAEGAKVQADQAKADAAAAPPVQQASAGQAAQVAVAKAQIAQVRARNLLSPPVNQIPRWSDLIVTESTRADGTVVREIDVARFQMLLFTLITATFVLMSVVTTYVIPEIPSGFQTLMGISNGVYLGAKVAQG